MCDKESSSVHLLCGVTLHSSTQELEEREKRRTIQGEEKRKREMIACIADRVRRLCGPYYGRTVYLEHRGLILVRNKQKQMGD